MKYQGSSEKAKALGQKTSKALSSGLQIIFSTQSGDCSVERKLFFDILGPINAGVGGQNAEPPEEKKERTRLQKHFAWVGDLFFSQTAGVVLSPKVS